MKNLTPRERKMLLHKHLKEGYSYNESKGLVEQACESIRKINETHRVEKRVNSNEVDFKKEFTLLVKTK